MEVAFGYRPGGVHARRMVTGINWSPSIGSDPFRTLGAESFAALLTQQRASSVEPVVVTVHVATPRVEFLDRGKSSVALPPIVGEVVVDLVTKATKKWAVQRKARSATPLPDFDVTMPFCVRTGPFLSKKRRRT